MPKNSIPKEFDILVKTPRGLEKIAASRIEELGGFKAIPRPYGLLGIVLVSCKGRIPREEAVNLISREVLEAEKVLPVHAIVKADLKAIANACREVVRGVIKEGETFAVRTTRRGRHEFTSIDVNIEAGRVIEELTGASVDLEVPDKIVWIEILHDIAVISITGREVEMKKLWPGKPYALPILRKISVIQMPYVGSREVAKEFGKRIGRSVQTFEIGELIIGLNKTIEAGVLRAFIEGIEEGIESRYSIQLRSYGREVHKVPVYVDNLYQIVRDRRDEPLIATSTKGKPLTEIKNEIVEIFTKAKRVNVLIGAREGLPAGIMRNSTIIVDLAPGITLPTDHAATAALIGLLTTLEEEGILPRVRRKREKRTHKSHASS